MVMMAGQVEQVRAALGIRASWLGGVVDLRCPVMGGRECVTCGAAAEDGRLYCGSHGPVEPTREELAAVRSGGTLLGARGGGQAAMVCPHCGVRGQVTRTAVKVKRGISGGKATGAVLTAGLSALATGLSRKARSTEMSCGNCGTTWHVD